MNEYPFVTVKYYCEKCELSNEVNISRENKYPLILFCQNCLYRPIVLDAMQAYHLIINKNSTSTNEVSPGAETET